jgi:hypothetical protein
MAHTLQTHKNKNLEEPVEEDEDNHGTHSIGIPNRHWALAGDE